MTSGRSCRTTARNDSGAARSAPERSRAVTCPSARKARGSSWPTWPWAPSTSIRGMRRAASGPIVLAHPIAVRTAGHALHPVRVVEVPCHGLADAARERLPRAPAQLALDLAGIHRVAPVMAGAILHEGDLCGVGLAVRPGPQLVQDAADGLNHLEVGLLVPPADVIDLAHLSGFEHAR